MAIGGIFGVSWNAPKLTNEIYKLRLRSLTMLQARQARTGAKAGL